ncbi:hypothetical protein [Cohnella sp. WQ 127256]|uniref:hypothetical protein n=1 Tax=Cohnella sp. WQ 127256 TaxID=2938790 RepID=UPI002117C449|nr:hypothetical protein [Cohnella sp. WQ 127256]
MSKGKPNSFILILMLLSAIFALSPATIVSAATVELTSSVKASFDKTVTVADKQTAAKLSTFYVSFGDLLKQDLSSESKIKALHYNNDEAIIALRKQISAINSTALNKLTVQLQQTKERHQPLFNSYTSVNKQITAAKSLKNKTLNALLRAQADVLKLSVQFAREDIKAKEAALKTEKTATSLKIKAARDLLSTIEPLKVQIKAQRSAANLPRSSMSPVWKNFKYAIKKKEVKGTLDSLSTLVLLARQIVEQQQKIYTLEVKISDIIHKTKSHFL